MRTLTVRAAAAAALALALTACSGADSTESGPTEQAPSQPEASAGPEDSPEATAATTEETEASSEEPGGEAGTSELDPELTVGVYGSTVSWQFPQDRTVDVTVSAPEVFTPSAEAGPRLPGGYSTIDPALMDGRTAVRFTVTSTNNTEYPEDADSAAVTVLSGGVIAHQLVDESAGLTYEPEAPMEPGETASFDIAFYVADPEDVTAKLYWGGQDTVFFADEMPAVPAPRDAMPMPEIGEVLSGTLGQEIIFPDQLALTYSALEPYSPHPDTSVSQPSGTTPMLATFTLVNGTNRAVGPSDVIDAYTDGEVEASTFIDHSAGMPMPEASALPGQTMTWQEIIWVPDGAGDLYVKSRWETEQHYWDVYVTEDGSLPEEAN